MNRVYLLQDSIRKYIPSSVQRPLPRAFHNILFGTVELKYRQKSPFLKQWIKRIPINRFADKAAILISVVSKDIMGCSGADEYVFAPRASYNSYLKQ